MEHQFTAGPITGLCHTARVNTCRGRGIGVGRAWQDTDRVVGKEKITGMQHCVISDHVNFIQKASSGLTPGGRENLVTLL